MQHLQGARGDRRPSARQGRDGSRGLRGWPEHWRRRRGAGLVPITGAKTLHLLGEPITPLGPTGRDIVRDWLAADLSRTDAVELAGCTESEFALAVYVETHDPIDEACEAVAEVLLPDGSPAVEKRDHLQETMSSFDDLLGG